MKRILALLLILSALTLLGACGSPAPEASAPSADRAALDSILADIRENMSVGTAGSSLRAAALAARLLDWAETARLSDEEIRAALEPWLAPQDDGVPADFREQLAAVGGMAAVLTGEDASLAEGLLSDAGCGDCGYPWSSRAADTVGRVMALAGADQASAEN